MNKKSKLKNIRTKIEEIKEYLQDNSLGGIHLTNLPQHLFETIGECIKDIKNVEEDCK